MHFLREEEEDLAFLPTAPPPVVPAEACQCRLMPLSSYCVLEGGSQGSGGAGGCPCRSLYWAGMSVSSSVMAREPPWISLNHSLDALGSHATVCLALHLSPG